MQDVEREIWVQIDDCPGYAISTYGRVMNTKFERIMQRSRNQWGNVYVRLFVDGRQRSRSVALLVVQTFVEKPPFHDPDFCNTPIHLDGDRENCFVENLEWRPRWYAMEYHDERDNQIIPPYWRDNPLVIKETGEVFSNVNDLCMTYGVTRVSIMQNLRKKFQKLPFNDVTVVEYKTRY